jgi:hypothetical protein
VRASFVAGLNDVFLVGALIAFVSAALTFVLIRTRDFETGTARVAPTGASTSQPERAEPAVR